MHNVSNTDRYANIVFIGLCLILAYKERLVSRVCNFFRYFGVSRTVLYRKINFNCWPFFSYFLLVNMSWMSYYFMKCIRYDIVFHVVLKNVGKWAKNLIFWLVLESFLLTHSYHLWVTNQVFGKLETLWRKKIVISFISKTFGVVKHPWNCPFWREFGSIIPKYGSILLTFSTEVGFMKTKTAFEGSFKNFEFSLKRDVPKILQFWSVFRPNVPPEKPKYC